MGEANHTALVQAVLDLVKQHAPETAFLSMYGGTIFELTPGNKTTRFGGVYAYDRHVSVEFAKGAAFSDPVGHLEGSGKQRRHLKLTHADDMKAKDLAGFFAQAIALSS